MLTPRHNMAVTLIHSSYDYLQMIYTMLCLATSCHREGRSSWDPALHANFCAVMAGGEGRLFQWYESHYLVRCRVPENSHIPVTN